MRYFLIAFSILMVTKLSAQNAAIKTDQGAINNQVTDIVVVFKMHVDIGYTNWAEGVLQMYCNDMLDETLKSIDETSKLPKSEQFVWTIPSWPLKYILENCSTEKKDRL